MKTIAKPLRFRISVALFATTLLWPSISEAQTVTYDDSVVEAIADVLEWLEGDEYTLIPEFGQWGLVFGWFSEGEEKDISFNVTVGERYMIAGGGDGNVDDIDICVYDNRGREVECDVATDAFPVVSFIAHSSGTWRATLTAYSLNSLAAYAGMALLSQN